MNARWITLIDAAALADALAHCAVALFDCRFDLAAPVAGEAAYRVGHIPGARFLDLERDLSGVPTGSNGRHPLPDPGVLAARLRTLGVDDGQQVVAYDDAGGAFAARAWWLLRWLGHGAVAVLDGGLPAWEAAGLPVRAGEEPAPVPGSFRAAERPGMPTIDADTILASRAPATRLVLDARTPERFRGEPHPLDPVSGHIPGARNRWFRDNLEADGRFKSPEALRAEYHALLAGTVPEHVVLQCGSGVTAAHDLLAMAHAGLGGAALYPGSWSEWISDPARPTARG